ncbi:hypothetical protein V8E54_013552 [Elaphomyces granulatus]
MAVHHRGQPSSSFLFHVGRFLSLISSLVIVAIMAYFTYHLYHEGYSLPWTFVVMWASAVLTVVHLGLSCVLDCCRYRSSFFSVAVNSFILLLWALSFGLLSWNMSKTLSRTCITLDWGSDAGTMVCRIYKALYAFVVIGLVAQFYIVMHDILARRRLRVHSRGEYGVMNNDTTAAAAMKFDQQHDKITLIAPAKAQPQTKRLDRTHHYYQNVNVVEQDHANEAQQYYDTTPVRGGSPQGTPLDYANPHESGSTTPRFMAMHEFSAAANNNLPPEQTRYDPVEYRDR